jgi:glycosyltransferase involved in cell wall biosynthesis
MTVLSVAYPLMPAGPDSGGGAEQILSLLERSLVEAGHESIVVAAEGSATRSELIQTPAPTGEVTDEMRRWAQAIHLACIERVLKTRSIDLIHFHGLDFHCYIPRTDTPVLATLHLPVAWYPRWILEARNLHLNCVSRAQAASAPGSSKLPVVVNGVDLERYKQRRGNGDYCLVLARICPEKGIDIALRAAHKFDIPMLIAGPVHPFHDHRAYFAERVQPLLDAKRRYIGPIGAKEKPGLLANARCLLAPSIVAETSSVVAMEALSAGTPVIAFRSGALPEVVENGVTGFIVDSEDRIGEAWKNLAGISPETCRREAKLHFDGRRMLRDYLSLYAQIAPEPARVEDNVMRRFGIRSAPQENL